MEGASPPAGPPPEAAARPVLRAGEPPLRVFVSSVMDDEMAQPRGDAVAALDKPAFLSPWAFEFTPASTEPLDESYLRQVREAEVVLWLVGSRTTEPVIREIREALAHDRPILIVRLSTAEPDERTNELLGEVGDRAKWVAVPPERVREAVALTFGDEFLRAWRGATPARARAALLDDRGRTSRARCIVRWQAAGLSRAESLVLADDSDVGRPPDDVRPTAERPLVILRGEVGAGKSLTTERLLQEAVARALDDVDAPVPIWLQARDVGSELVPTIGDNCDGIGTLEQNGAFVVIDGAEEAGAGTASALLEAARIAVEAWPGVRIVMSSRPLPVFTGIEEAVDLSALSEDESLALISRLVGRDISGHGWPAAVRDASRRPLWAVLLAVDLRVGVTGHSTGELMRNLVRRAVTTDDSPAHELLRQLARLSTERGEAPVSVSELTRPEQLALLRESGLVVERAGSVRFGLPILTQWFAAQSLIAGEPGIDELASDPARLDLWRYAFIIALGEVDWSCSADLFEPVVRSDPGFASEVIGEAIRSSIYPSEERAPLGEPLSVGRTVHHAAAAWLAGLGPVANLLAVARPDGSPHQLGVSVDDESLMTMWRQFDDQQQDVIELPPDVHIFGGAPGWGPGRLSRPAPEPAWPWRWAHEDVVSSLKPWIESEVLGAEHGPVFLELAWVEALAVLNKGSLHPGPLPIGEIEAILDRVPVDTMLRASSRTYDLRALRARVGELREAGASELPAPWPGWDLDLETSGGWVWGPYSPQRLLERATAVYEGGLHAYMALVERWFPTLRHRLRLAVTLPGVLRGRLYFIDIPGENPPALDWTIEPLPAGEETTVDLVLTTEGHRASHEARMERLREQQRRLVELRPQAARWISAHATQEALSIFGARPATELAFKWLANDLKRIQLQT